MGHPFEQPAADIAAPVKYDSTAGAEYSGVFTKDHTASAQVAKVPTAWRGKYVTFQSVGADCDIAFGSATNISITQNQPSSIDGTTKAITLSAATGFTIVDDTSISFRIPVAPASGTDNYAYFVWITAGTTGYLKAYCSENFRP